MIGKKRFDGARCLARRRRRPPHRSITRRVSPASGDRRQHGAAGVVAPPAGWGGFTLGYAVADAATVDAVCGDAAGAGATITRQPVEKPFGYSGVFADPDGHTWEVAYIEALVLRDDGTVAMPS